MFGSVMLDVAIGLIVIYLILSFVCTAVREVLEGFLKDRGSLLHKGICELLDDASFIEDLYEHPLVSSLYRGTYRAAKVKNLIGASDLPSYIPSRNFALALLDMTVRGRKTAPDSVGVGAGVLSVATIRQNIGALRSDKVQRVVLTALDTSGGDIAKTQEAIESWFNSSMDRVSGWYKRRTQWILVLLGVAIAVVANVDTLRLASSFYKDPGQRQAAVAMAGNLIKTPLPGTGAQQAQAGNAPVVPAPAASARDTTRKPPASSDAIGDAVDAWSKLDKLALPIGWPDPNFGIMRIIGWLLTGLAISLGAPFWFDLLSKFMSVRSSLKPADEPPVPAAGQAPSPSNVVNAALAPPAAAVVSPGVDYQPHAWASGHAQAGII